PTSSRTWPPASRVRRSAGRNLLNLSPSPSPVLGPAPLSCVFVVTFDLKSVADTLSLATVCAVRRSCNFPKSRWIFAAMPEHARELCALKGLAYVGLCPPQLAQRHQGGHPRLWHCTAVRKGRCALHYLALSSNCSEGS